MIVGIDVSKSKLDVCILSKNKFYVLKNTKASIRSFFRNKLSKEDLELVVFEATGGYEKWLQSYLLEEKIAYHRAHPTRVRRFAEGKGYFAKTDRLDAKVLANYGNQPEIIADEHTSQDQLRIREYSSRKTQLKGLLAAETQRLKVISFDKQITRSIKRMIKQLEQELKLITEKLNILIDSDEELGAKRKLLQTAKGIGVEVSTILVTNLPELGRLNREEISHLVGVAPQTKDSGQKQSYRAISRGRFYVRKALYMAALVASRYDPRMKKIYNKLLARGKAKKVALVAIMRKMIIMLNAMVRNMTPWRCKEI